MSLFNWTPEASVSACAHDLALISAQPLTPSEGMVMCYACTVVLRRCRSCGMHQTQTLAGSWSLHQLLLETNEVATIERMFQ